MHRHTYGQSKPTMGRRVALIAVGSLLIADTLYAAAKISMNVGVILPALIGLPLLAIGAIYPFWQQWTARSVGRALKWAIALAYGAFGALFLLTGALMLGSAVALPSAGADAVIVLGCALRGYAPSALLQYRCDAAAAYLRDSPDAIAVVSGGQGRGEMRSEASAMAEALALAGIEPSRIVQEAASTSTEENFDLSVPLLEARLGKKATDCRIVYVTSGFHVYRAGYVAKRLGLRAEGLAARSNPQFLLNHVLRECVVIVVAWLKG